MNKLIAIALILLSGAVLAEDAKPRPKGKRLTREQFEAKRYRNTGGYLVKPGSQQGKIVYVNAQKAVPVDWIKANASELERKTKIVTAVEDGGFAFPPAKIYGNASVFIVDDEKLPGLLSAPEDRWVMVNVAQLKKGEGAKEAFFRARVGKELTRGFAILAGSQSSNYPGSLVGCITKAEQLDTFVDNMLPVDVFARFTEYVAGYGIIPRIDVPYRSACYEGWAPQPTNDIQKAFWDQAHAMPSKPLKLEK